MILTRHGSQTDRRSATDPPSPEDAGYEITLENWKLVGLAASSFTVIEVKLTSFSCRGLSDALR